MSGRSFTSFMEHQYEFRQKWTALRLIGSMHSVYEFWIPIVTFSGNQTNIRKLCLDWNSLTHSMEGEVCPYRSAGLKGRAIFYSNAIIRKLQKTVEKGGTKATQPDTPVRVIKIPPLLHGMLQNLTAINSKSRESGKRKIYNLAHPKFGRDIRIKINPGDPYSYYELGSVALTRLSREERQYALWPLGIEPETPAEAWASWNKLRKIWVAD